MPNQPSVEQAHRQMGALDISRALAQQRQDFIGLAEDDAQFGVDQVSVLVTMLDHLQILPAGLRLFPRRRTATARVLRNLTIDGNHGVIIAAPAIRHRWWRSVGMPACLQRLEDFLRSFGFGFRDAARDAEPSVDVQHGRASELARCIGFGVVLFSPLLPT